MSCFKAKMHQIRFRLGLLFRPAGKAQLLLRGRREGEREGREGKGKRGGKEEKVREGPRERREGIIVAAQEHRAVAAYAYLIISILLSIMKWYSNCL